MSVDEVEIQISELKKAVSFDSRDFPIESICSKYITGIDSDQNEIFVPEYQRDFVWDESRQSRLIESIALGLPIPPIFVAENLDGRLEIVDGSQRIRTLSAFLENNLKIEKLTKVTKLNGLCFQDLDISRQRKIKNTTLNFIVLSESANEEVRSDLFDRINKGSDILRNMEKRKGIYRGEFTDFIYELGESYNLFKDNIRLSRSVEKRQEREELILRFFALTDSYPRFSQFSRNVSEALDRYIENQNKNFTEKEREIKREEFSNMTKFVVNNFQSGFLKGDNSPVSRVYFEAIAVGTHLAIKQKTDLRLRNKITVSELLGSKNSAFSKSIFSTRETHSTTNILTRVDTIKNTILAKEA